MRNITLDAHTTRGTSVGSELEDKITIKSVAHDVRNKKLGSNVNDA